MSIIFWCWKPDNCSGGRSILQNIYRKINNASIKKIYIFVECGVTAANYTEEIYNKIKKEYETPDFLIASPSMIADKENIFVYTEDLFNANPLEGKNIVRLCCYFDVAENINVNNEYYIFYSSVYKQLYNVYNNYNRFNNHTNIFPKYINYLYNLKEILDKCKDYGQERSNSCFTIRKGVFCPHYHTEFNFHPPDSLEIHHSDSYLDNLIIIFNKYKFFYTYDVCTNMVQIASLCGCIPIIVPFGGYNNIKDFWKEEWFHYGLVYKNCKNYLELNDSDIEYAYNTREILRNKLENISNIDYDSLFVEMCEHIYNFFREKN